MSINSQPISPEERRRRAAQSQKAMRERVEQRAYSPAEAAIRLGISLATVNRLIRSGKLKSTKLAGRRVVSDDAIEAILSPAD